MKISHWMLCYFRYALLLVLLFSPHSYSMLTESKIDAFYRVSAVDYYEHHMSVASPIGTLDLGRSLHRGGWVYGYNLFLRNFEENRSRAFYQYSDFSNVDCDTSRSTCRFSVTLHLRQEAKGVLDNPEFARCTVNMTIENINWRAIRPRGNGLKEEDVAYNSSCQSTEVSQFQPALDYIFKGVDIRYSNIKERVDEVIFQNVSGFLRVLSKIKEDGINFSFNGIRPIILEYYDPQSGRTFGHDVRIRYAKKQKSDPILFHWPKDIKNNAVYLVPDKITDKDNNVILDFAPVLVKPNGIEYYIPTQMLDSEGRRIQYQYDDDRLIQRTDLNGHEWLYSYDTYRPISRPQDQLKRLKNVTSPEGNIVEFYYQPASAIISGYKTAAGEGFNRTVSWKENAFGVLEKTENKEYHNGRIESRIYRYGEAIDVPPLTGTEQKTDWWNPNADTLKLNRIKAGNKDLFPDTIFPEWVLKPLPKRWVYVSFGGYVGDTEPEEDLNDATRFYGQREVGGGSMSDYLNEQSDRYKRDSALVEKAKQNNRGTRILDRFEVNGEVQYRYDKKFENQDGTQIVINTRSNTFGQTRTSYQYLKYYTRGAKPNSHTKITETGQADTHLYYDENGYLERREQGNIRYQYTYDGYKNLLNYQLQHKDDGGAWQTEREIRYTYDHMGNRLTMTYQGDHQTDPSVITSQYNDWSQLVQRQDGEGHTIYYRDFHATGQPQTVEDARGAIWKNTYNAQGQRTTLQSPLHVKNTQGVDLPQTYQWHYNQDQHLIGITYPDNSQQTFKPDGDGVVLEDTDELGYSVHYQYDEMHNLESITEPADNDISEARRWAYSYTPFNLVDTATSPGGDVTNYRYQLDRLSTSQYPTYQSTYRYNSQGVIEQQQTTELNATPGVDPKQQRYGYDNLLRNILSQDSLNRQQQTQYNAANQITQQTDAKGGITFLEWDRRGNLISVTDPENNVHQYQYDKNNRQVAEILPNGETRRYQYDANGNRSAHIKPNGHTLGYLYDAINRLTTVVYLNNEQDWQSYQSDPSSVTPEKTIRYQYDARNRLIGYNDGQIQQTYQYNLRGERTQAITDFGTFSKTQQYDYYPSGQLKSYTNPEGITYTYRYNANGQLQAVTIPNVGQLAYPTYAWQQPDQLNLPGGSRIAFSYDGFQRLTGVSLLNSAGQTLASNRYQHDSEDNITAIQDSRGQHQLDYSNNNELNQHQLTTNNSSQPSTLANYEYDGVGNRTSSVGTDNVYSSDHWDYSHNQLNSIAATETSGKIDFIYNTNGHTQEKITYSSVDDAQVVEHLLYHYDQDERLTSIQQKIGTGDQATVKDIAEYRYNPMGQRYYKHTSTESTYYLYNPMGLAAEYQENGDLLAEYHYSPEYGWGINPLFTRQNLSAGNLSDQYFYYKNDTRFAPERLIDITGQTVWSGTYGAFGELIETENTHSLRQPLRFPGQYADKETHLYYNWNRYYDAGTGRYIQRDPIGLAAGLNTYAYVDGNPLIYVDPKGLFLCSLLNGLPGTINLGVAGGFGLAGSLGVGLSSGGVSLSGSTGAGLGLSADISWTGSLSGSLGSGGGGVHGSGVHVGGSTTISGGNGIVGGSASISAGTDGVEGSVSGGWGLGGAIVSGVYAKGQILKCPPDNDDDDDCN